GDARAAIRRPPSSSSLMSPARSPESSARGAVADSGAAHAPIAPRSASRRDEASARTPRGPRTRGRFGGPGSGNSPDSVGGARSRQRAGGRGRAAPKQRDGRVRERKDSSFPWAVAAPFSPESATPPGGAPIRGSRRDA